MMQQPAPGDTPSRIASLLRWLVVVWAGALTVYFLNKQGLFDWRPLDFPGAPDRLLRGNYATVLNHLAGPYTVWWDNVPWGPLGISAGMLLAYAALGWLVVSALRLYVSRLAVACLSLTVGTGMAGIGFMFVALAGQLTRTGVAAGWGALFVIAFVARSLLLSRRGSIIPGVAPIVEFRRRLYEARAYHRATLSGTGTPGGRAYFASAWILAGIISAALVLHGIAFPETYWDSLILYMGYARMMFEEHGFPVKVVGQVGIGLGANYPHLYPTLSAQTATLAGAWSDTFAQLLPPVASLVSMLFVYLVAEELTRDRLVAVASSLVYRAIPYGLSYGQFASDYAVAILFTSAFVYCALLTIRYGWPAAFGLMLLSAAFAVNVNYLMWVLWPVAVLVLILAHTGVHLARPAAPPEPDEFADLDLPAGELLPPPWLAESPRPALKTVLGSGHLWATVALALALALPWYVRNTVMTGNPVYAFYYKVFPSKHVNPDVMRSAEVEWRLNGDGLWTAGRTLPEKLMGSWRYFVSGNHAWKLSPAFAAFVLPGFLVAAGMLLRRRPAGDPPPTAPEQAGTRGFLATAGTLFLLLWFYAYVIADFYLYQIIVVLPLFGVFTAVLLGALGSGPPRRLMLGLCLLVGFAPGVVMGLMGFKLKRGSESANAMAPQMQLTALRNLFMDRTLFYHMELGGDYDMFLNLKMLPPGAPLLTHENRHLLLRPGQKVIHLDDWEVQQAYGKPVAERVAILDRLGIRHYLYVTNEDKHVANSWLGMDELVAAGYYREMHRTPARDGSSRDHLKYKAIPPDVNVLYERTDKKP